MSGSGQSSPPRDNPGVYDQARRLEYLNKLREEIEQQNYNVSAEAVAEKIIESEMIE